MPAIDVSTAPAAAEVTEARARLLAGARRCFAEHGFGATSIRDIGRVCGINSATMYSHFSSKAALFIAIVDPYLDAVQSAFAAAAQSSGSGAERLERMIDATVEVQLERREEYVSLLRDWHRTRAQTELAGVVARRQEGSVLWLDVIRDGIDDGSIRSDLTPREAQWLITNTVASIFDDRFEGPPAESPNEVERRRILQVVLDGLRPTPRPPTTPPIDARTGDCHP